MKGDSPNPLGRTLGLIHRDQHRHHSDAQTGEYTTDDKERENDGGDLHGDASREDEGSADDGPSPPQDVGRRSREQSSEERASGQDGDDEGLLGRGDGAFLGGGVVFSKDA